MDVPRRNYNSITPALISFWTSCFVSAGFLNSSSRNACCCSSSLKELLVRALIIFGLEYIIANRLASNSFSAESSLPNIVGT